MNICIISIHDLLLFNKNDFFEYKNKDNNKVYHDFFECWIRFHLPNCSITIWSMGSYSMFDKLQEIIPLFVCIFWNSVINIIKSTKFYQYNKVKMF